MVKKRIICSLLWDDFGCVKGRQFRPDRRIGSMMQAIRVMERREIDELVILDISATPRDMPPRFEEIQEFTSQMSCPVTVGGGVAHVEDAVKLLAAGADKIAICTAALEAPGLIIAMAEKIGSQSVVCCIDVKDRTVVSQCGTHPHHDLHPAVLAQEFERLGAGEILLTAVHRDGTMDGYDLDLIRRVASVVNIPVIANGGCRSYADMESAFGAGADAVCAGALFQFTQCTPKEAARYLDKQGIPVRVL